MSRHTMYATTALALMAAPATAELTPAQAWGALKDQMALSGYQVSGTEVPGDSALVIENALMTFEFPMPDDAGTGNLAVDMGTVTFADIGDGVRVDYPEVIKLMMDLVGEDGEDIEITVDYRHEGLDMVLTGDPDAILYSIGADLLSLELTELLVDDDPVERDEIAIQVDFNSVTAQNLYEPGEMSRNGQDWDIGSIALAASFEIEDTKETGRVNVTVADVSLESEGTVPEAPVLTNLATMLGSGMAGSARFARGASAVSVEFEAKDGPFNLTSRSDSGLMVVSLEDGAVGIAAGSKGLENAVTAASFPFPIEVSAEEASMNLSVPILPTEEARPFMLGLGLQDLSVSDDIWDLVDPFRALPRDPATLMAQISGAARLLVDVTDPEQMEAVEEGEMTPGEVESLSLDAFELSLAGARVLGDGAFTFDSEDLDTFSGLPRPEGSVNVQIDGAQGLIDKLIQMGLLTEDSALGARMALTMFAVPGAGPDSLTSTIEVNSQGHVLANGMRVR